MALYKDVTLNRGVKDTSLAISQEKPLEISSDIWKYNPLDNTGLMWVLRNGGHKSTPRREFGHLESVFHPQWVEYVGDNESSQATTGLVFKTGQGPRMTTGNCVFFPATNQIIRLTAVMSTDTTGAVTRNFGRGTAASFLSSGDKGLLLSPKFQQGSTPGLGLTTNKKFKSFFVSEVAWPVQLTNIEAAEITYQGDPFAEALADALKDSKNQLEADLYWSGQIDTTVSGVPISATEGMDNFVITNVYSAEKVNRIDLWDILAEIRGKYKGRLSLHCSMAFVSMVTNWGMNLVYYTQDTEVDGLMITKLRTPFGEYELVPIGLFDQEPNLMGTVFFVPDKHVDYRPLVGYEDLDIRFYPLNDREHWPVSVANRFAKESVIYGVTGWHFKSEQDWGKLSGLRFAA